MHRLLPVRERLARVYERTAEVAMWQVSSWLPIGPLTANGRVIAPGDPWPEATATRFAGGEFAVPDNWPLDASRLELFLGGEAQLWIEHDDGTARAFGHDRYHRAYALRRRTGRLRADAVPRGLLGSPVVQPRLEVARLVCLEPAVERFVRRLHLTRMTAEALGEHEVVEAMIDAAEQSLGLVELPSATAAYLGRFAGRPETDTDYQLPSFTWSMPEGVQREAPLGAQHRRSIETADAHLVAQLRELRRLHPAVGRVVVTGHAHIDLAWLWPMDETWRKARRSFATAVDLLERYPEFRFAHSSAAVYARLAEDDSPLLERIVSLARAGAWEPSGGMWVEPDTVMPTGESLVRQGLYGQRHFARTFGRPCRVGWIPDSFGFSGALPQILQHVGLDSMFTAKLYWSESNVFPHSSFRWRGIDGSEVLVHAMRDDRAGFSGRAGYNGKLTPAEILNAWRMHADRNVHEEALQPAGHGDGGGGPTAEMIESARVLSDMPVLPAVQFGHPGEFFARLHEDGSRVLPTWNGELYLEFHRGTLTTQGRTKRLHRRAEQALIQAEALGGFGALLGGELPESLESVWRILLQNQFHDILPGTSIGEVHANAERELVSVERAARSRAQMALDTIAHCTGTRAGIRHALLANVDTLSQGVRLERPTPLPGWQPVANGFVFAADGAVPPFTALSMEFHPPSTPARAGDDWLENAFVRVTLGPSGELASVFDKRAAREVLDGPGNQLWVFADRPRIFDAWDIEHDYERQSLRPVLVEGPTCVENGPYRSAMRLLFRIADSTVEQTIRLWSNSPRIEFHTRLDWRDRKLLLKVRFPVAVRAEQSTCECAYGVVSRPTHANTPWEAARFEVSGHRFADLSEPRYGVALLNDGRYGHRLTESMLELSLLRSPAWPDFRADEGLQEVVYALLPHQGAWHESGVLEEAAELNRPVAYLPVEDAVHAMSPLRIRGNSVALGALKTAEDGDGLVLRVYEPFGARGALECDVDAPGWHVGAAVDGLENEIASVEGVRPFQIRAWRLDRRGRQSPR